MRLFENQHYLTGIIIIIIEKVKMNVKYKSLRHTAATTTTTTTTLQGVDCFWRAFGSGLNTANDQIIIQKSDTSKIRLNDDVHVHGTFD